jgi:hypothetical protein
MTYNLERRLSPRKRFENLLYVEVEPGNGGMVLNLSENGFGFRAVKRVRPNTEVKFAFNLDEKRRLEGRGRLEWSDKEGRVAGVQFTDVSDEFLSDMRSWMANATEYPMQNGGSRPSSSVTSVPAVTVATKNGKNGSASESSASVDHAASTNGHAASTNAHATTTDGHAASANGRAASTNGHAASTNRHNLGEEPTATKSVRSITSVPSPVPFPLPPEKPAESFPSETSNKRDAGSGTWTSLPPAVGADRKPTPPRPRTAAQAGSDFSAATAYKLDRASREDVEDLDLSGDFELAEESSASTDLGEQGHGVATERGEDPIASLEERTARALNEHAQALLQHFQHEEQHTLAAFREAVARMLRDSERQLFPIREAAQAQIKSLESAVASAGASVKVLDRYPSLLERAQQQALDRFQTQIQGILHSHVMEMRRRSETVLEQINVRAESAGLEPGRIRTSSGIIVTVVLVMLLVGLFVFRREASEGFIWLGQQMVEPAPVPESAKTNAPQAKPSPGPVTKPPVQQAKPPVTEAKPPGPEAKPPVAETKPAEEAKSADEPKADATEPDTTANESARRTQSVKSLWDEVAKGNVTAQLTLGNMYFTGHGVTKNCYQARRLFAAAARKGSVEGKQRLAELDRSTCL